MRRVRPSMLIREDLDRRKLSTFLRQSVRGFIGSGFPPRVC